MPRAYHNLDGWIRDVESAARSEDAEGRQRWSRVVDFLEWALEEIEGPGDGDVPEGDDSTPEAEVDGSQLELRSALLEGPGGPAEGLRSVSPPASLLDRALDGLAGEERARAIAELDSLRRDAVAAPGPMSKRRLKGAKAESNG